MEKTEEYKKEVEEMEQPILMKKYTCERCGYSWIPRSEEIPETCPNPKCRSPYWNKPRKILSQAANGKA